MKRQARRTTASKNGSRGPRSSSYIDEEGATDRPGKYEGETATTCYCGLPYVQKVYQQHVAKKICALVSKLANVPKHE